MVHAHLVPPFIFDRLAAFVPKISTLNPIHAYLTSPHEGRSDSGRGEIFSSRRQNHLTGGGLLIHPDLFARTYFRLFC